MRWSIRFQLLVPLLTLLLGVVGMSAWAAFASAARARCQIETQVRGIAHEVGQLPYPLKKEKVLNLIKGFSGADFLVVDSKGRHETTFPNPDVAVPALIVEADAWETLTLDQRVKVNGTPYLASGVHLSRGENAGSTLYIYYPESLWRDALWAAVRPSLILGGVLGVAAFLLAVGVAHRLSRRVRELERRTRLIAGGDFSPMPLPARNDELRDLTQSVNEMAQQLARYQETVRRSERLRLLGQVSGGLAHQLRNGVTGARLAVQLHVRECRSHDDAESLSVALRQLTLVEMHLKRFLDLGRAEELRQEPCALPVILEETVALLRPQCQHAHIDLRWRSPEATAGGLTVRGDAGQLGHLFLNLASNAVEAAGPGGWVEVRVAGPQAGRATVEVLDSGPGPAADVAERLFEPFITGKKEGVGLGLAVARQVAEAHGGQISWGRASGRTCFTVDLPLESCS
jgi:signal transduction histidine kinase